MANRWGDNGISDRLFSWAPKSVQMVMATMKLKDACSLEKSYGKPQFSSVAQLCLTLYNPMDCSTSGLPVHHQPLKPTQTHVYRIGDAIQPSHPLSSSPPTFNLSQHQGLSQ